MFKRNIEKNIREALTDTPVVLINGARQTGKSTLAAKIATDFKAQYITLDDATVLSAAATDPAGFIMGMNQTVVIDEIQKAPGLFGAIKAQVDSDRRPGRYLLTGSANILLVPRLSESLAGRIEIITLWPLSQGELMYRQEHFIDRVFSPSSPEIGADTESSLDLPIRLLKGGYPEAIRRKAEKRRHAWFRSYITTILQRDVRDLANIEGLTDMPRLLMLFAARVGGILNMSELSRSSGIPHTTLKRYLTLLQTTFLLTLLPAWSSHLGKRLIKSPKIYLIDSGLVSHLVGQTVARLRSDNTFFGHLLECFVVGELRKLVSWSKTRVELFHFRTTSGTEVDIVLEDEAGRLVGIEVKASATVTRKDFSGIEVFAELVGPRFLRGLVLYRGNQTVPFGKNLFAIPVSALEK